MHYDPDKDADECGRMSWELAHKLRITHSSATARRDVVHERLFYFRQQESEDGFHHKKKIGSLQLLMFFYLHFEYKLGIFVVPEGEKRIFIKYFLCFFKNISYLCAPKAHTP